MAEPTDVFDRLLQIALLLQHDMDGSFTGRGLTPARVHLLWVLHHSGPSTQQALAAGLQVSARNVTGLVDALETHGFVTRGRHPSDRRAVLVELTPLGRRTTTDMVRDRAAAAARLVDGFSAPRLRRLTEDLDTLAARLTEMGDPA